MATLHHGYVVLRGFRTGLGLGLMRFTEPPDRAGAVAGVPLPAVDDYVMWNVGLATRGELEDAGPELLHDNAIRRLRGWHRDVRTLVAAAAPDLTLLAPGLRAERPAAWVAVPGHRPRRRRARHAAGPRLGRQPRARGRRSSGHRRCRGWRPTT